MELRDAGDPNPDFGGRTALRALVRPRAASSLSWLSPSAFSGGWYIRIGLTYVGIRLADITALHVTAIAAEYGHLAPSERAHTSLQLGGDGVQCPRSLEATRSPKSLKRAEGLPPGDGAANSKEAKRVPTSTA